MDGEEIERLNGVTERIIACAIKVHRALGPGLLESAYEACLGYELLEAGLRVEHQKPVPLVYGSLRLECGCRLDMLVEDEIVLEIKAIEALTELHKAQLLSYLRLARHPVGLLINFNVTLLRSGIRRGVNNL